MKHERSGLLTILMVGCGLWSVGCATAPYRLGRFQTSGDDGRAQRVVFEYGEPHKVLDRMAWVAALPTRILPLNRKVNSHTLSPETSGKLETYLVENDLTDVLVRVNQYDPGGEWRRLRQNRWMSPGWKYTFGSASVIGYTLFPGRVFGGDLYNPFTNSLYVNSDVPAILIVEAAYAKDIHARSLPGAYAAVNEFPVLTLWRHTLAVNDTLGYALKEDDWELERETYRTVYPLMGVHAAMGGHTAASWMTAMPMITVPISMVGGAVLGHTVGQTTISQRERERKSEADEKFAAREPIKLPEGPKAAEVESGIQLTGFAEMSVSEAATEQK